MKGVKNWWMWTWGCEAWHLHFLWPTEQHLATKSHDLNVFCANFVHNGKNFASETTLSHSNQLAMTQAIWFSFTLQLIDASLFFFKEKNFEWSQLNVIFMLHFLISHYCCSWLRWSSFMVLLPLAAFWSKSKLLVLPVQISLFFHDQLNFLFNESVCLVPMTKRHAEVRSSLKLFTFQFSNFVFSFSLLCFAFQWGTSHVNVAPLFLLIIIRFLSFGIARQVSTQQVKTARRIAELSCTKVTLREQSQSFMNKQVQEEKSHHGDNSSI